MHTTRWQKALSLLLLFSLLCLAPSGLAETTDTGWAAQRAALIAGTENPLINKDATAATVGSLTPAHKTLNILLLGIDDQEKNYTYRTEMAHTDAIMLLSVNLEADNGGDWIDLISVPRDSMAYVPGVKGIYKINGAINCGDALAVGASRADDDAVVAESETGFQTVCDTVSWLLGGVQIDYYCAVTMSAMEALGDAIGGVDFDLEMSYTGHSLTHYTAGYQHLDGAGILDYLRARKNATEDTGSDVARTNRQREMIEAIIGKFLDDHTLVLAALDALQSNEDVAAGFYTNLTLTTMAQLITSGFKLAPAISAGDTDALAASIGSYTLAGDYKVAFGNWKFTFTDAANRADVLETVFGVTVPDIRYISYDYADWLQESGFQAVRHLAVVDSMMAFLNQNYAADTGAALTDAQQAALSACQSDYLILLRDFIAAADAVDNAALTGGTADDTLTQTMLADCLALRKSGDTLAEAIGYPAGIGKAQQDVTWYSGVYMDEDPLINEIYVNFR